MNAFTSVSILLPTLNETHLFTQTADIILDECDLADIKELVVIVCERTAPASLLAIETAKSKCEARGLAMNIIWQTLPFAGGAVRDGMDFAGGSHTLLCSADMETDPHLIPEFIRMARQFPQDMITASRWRDGGSFEGYSPVKKFCNRIFQKFFSILYNTRLTDMTFGYRCAPTKLFQSIAWEELKHPFFLETVLKPLRLGVRVYEIPAKWKARDEGESQNSFWETFKYFGIAFRARFEPRSRLLRKQEAEREKVDPKV
ncbi:MAG: glycosyltransferase family 2 protein [Oscillospiraceae bacterium]|jgi:glycosyltransferase involved in cell wall biosynthesis|nr:glycosyltransferase family 2 protein [Oscillospiraceae bacterium]